LRQLDLRVVGRLPEILLHGRVDRDRQNSAGGGYRQPAPGHSTDYLAGQQLHVTTLDGRTTRKVANQRKNRTRLALQFTRKCRLPRYVSQALRHALLRGGRVQEHWHRRGRGDEVQQLVEAVDFVVRRVLGEVGWPVAG